MTSDNAHDSPEVTLTVGDMADVASVPLCVELWDAQGRASHNCRLDAGPLTVGRSERSNIYIADRSVSANHLRIERDGDRAVVMDLQSTNGSRLEGVRLAPNQAHIWQPGEKVQIGDYELRLTRHNGMPNLAAVGENAARPPARPTMEMMAPAMNRAPMMRATLTLDKPVLQIMPGEPTRVRLELANVGDTADRWELTQNGFPARWIVMPEGAVELDPGDAGEAELLLDVPRVSNSRAGTYDVVFQARPLSGGAASEVKACWTIKEFQQHSIVLQPVETNGKRSKHQEFEAVLRNEGNAPVRCALSAPALPDMAVNLQEPVLRAEPGAEVSVRVNVSAPRRLLGRPNWREVVVVSRAEDGETSELPQEARARYMQTATLPAWAPLALLAVLLTAGLGLWVRFYAVGSKTKAGKQATSSKSKNNKGDANKAKPDKPVPAASGDNNGGNAAPAAPAAKPQANGAGAGHSQAQAATKPPAHPDPESHKPPLRKIADKVREIPGNVEKKAKQGVDKIQDAVNGDL